MTNLKHQTREDTGAADSVRCPVCGEPAAEILSAQHVAFLVCDANHGWYWLPAMPGGELAWWEPAGDAHNG